MSKTSTRSGLSERLRQNLARRSREIEEASAAELKRLAERLRGVASDALRSIASDTERQAATARQDLAAMWSGARQEAATVQVHLKRAWLVPLAVGLSCCLGISLGSWGVMRWLSRQIETQLQTRSRLAAEIREQEQTLERLQGQTWGVYLHEDGQGRFVVLPAGAEPDATWEHGGRRAVRFSSK